MRCAGPSAAVAEHRGRSSIIKGCLTALPISKVWLREENGGWGAAHTRSSKLSCKARVGISCNSLSNAEKGGG